MDDGTPAPKRCSICGDPLRVNNAIGICTNSQKPECQQARERERWRRRREGGTVPVRLCTVCGGRLRSDNTTGICSGTGTTSDCNRMRKNLDRIALGLQPFQPAQDVTEVHAGDTFGFWTVMEDGRGVVNYVSCRCKCGAERPVAIARLTEGKSTSCGVECLARRSVSPYLPPGTYGSLEVLEAGLRSADLVRVHCNRCGNDMDKQAFLVKRKISDSCGCGRGRFTHGLSGHTLYGVWNSMWDRCTNPRATGYKDWGGRGIKACERWRDLAVFIEDIEREIGPRPEDVDARGRHLYEFDRIDNDGNYESGNVRWADRKTQAGNRRTVMKIERQRDAIAARLAEVEQQLAEARGILF